MLDKLRGMRYNKTIKATQYSKKGGIYMAYDRLKVRIFELKKTQKKVAAELGLSEASFGQKINGKRPFTIPEAEKLIELLNIENPASIFFNR